MVHHLFTNAVPHPELASQLLADLVTCCLSYDCRRSLEGEGPGGALGASPQGSEGSVRGGRGSGEKERGAVASVDSYIVASVCALACQTQMALLLTDPRARPRAGPVALAAPSGAPTGAGPPAAAASSAAAAAEAVGASVVGEVGSAFLGEVRAAVVEATVGAGGKGWRSRLPRPPGCRGYPDGDGELPPPPVSAADAAHRGALLPRLWGLLRSRSVHPFFFVLFFWWPLSHSFGCAFLALAVLPCLWPYLTLAVTQVPALRALARLRAVGLFLQWGWFAVLLLFWGAGGRTRMTLWRPLWWLRTCPSSWAAPGCAGRAWQPSDAAGENSRLPASL